MQIIAVKKPTKTADLGRKTAQTATITQTFTNETGLYYYGARYLDPKTSCWLSGDPALGEYVPSAPINDEAKKRNGSLPGPGGVFNYVNLHVYHYAGNNPVKYTDPDGEKFIIAGNIFYKWKVKCDLRKIEKALIKSGDEDALNKFRAIKDDKNYNVVILKKGPNYNLYVSEDYQDNKGRDINGTIFYDPSDKTGGEDMTGNHSRPGFICLGHEIGHAIDERSDPEGYYSKGGYPDEWLDYFFAPSSDRPPKPYGFPNKAEEFAVDFENRIRKGYNNDPEFQRPVW
jgi:RHS repeat-associated protein